MGDIVEMKKNTTVDMNGLIDEIVERGVTDEETAADAIEQLLQRLISENMIPENYREVFPDDSDEEARFKAAVASYLGGQVAVLDLICNRHNCSVETIMQDGNFMIG